MITFAFVTSVEYEHRLAALIDSIKKHISIPATYEVLSCEPHVNFRQPQVAGATITPLNKAIPNWEEMMNKVPHISGVARAFFIKYLLEAGHNKVIYLDSDMYCYDDLASLSTLLDTHDFIVTPHITRPYPEDGKSPNMENIVRAGNYNSGFLGVKNTMEARGFMKWWVDMCQDKADVDYGKAHYSEQNWLRFLPDFVPTTHILRHSGYNLAHWNFQQRGLIKCSNKWQTSDGPLYLAHFSSLSKDTGRISTNQNRAKSLKGDPMNTLITEYKALFPNERWPEWKGGVCG